MKTRLVYHAHFSCALNVGSANQISEFIIQGCSQEFRSGGGGGGGSNSNTRVASENFGT